MWTLFTGWVRLDEEAWVLTEMEEKLKEFGSTKSFQLKQAPDSLLEDLFPRHLAAIHTRVTRRQSDAEQPPAQDNAVVAAFGRQVTDTRAARRSRKRGRDDKSARDEEAAAFNFVVTQALHERNLEKVPNKRQPALTGMEAVANKAMADYPSTAHT